MNYEPVMVEALAASWIEIFIVADDVAVAEVEALAASWIEIAGEGSNKMDEASKPLRLRGLKWYITINVNGITRRSPCGFVD